MADYDLAIIGGGLNGVSIARDAAGRGLRVILLAHEGSRARGQEFAITQGSPQVQRLLSITSVAEHMRVLSTPDDPAA